MSLEQVRCPNTMKFFLYLSFRTHAQPPRGFDAVIGEPGGDLNYDECVGA